MNKIKNIANIFANITKYDTINGLSNIKMRNKENGISFA